MGWFPRVMNMKDNPDIKKVLQSFHDLVWPVLFPIIFIFFIFNNELIQLFAPDYDKSILVIFFLSMSIIFIGMNNLFYNTGLRYIIKNKVHYLCLIASLSINVISSYFGSIFWHICCSIRDLFGVNYMFLPILYNKRLFNMNFGLFRPIIYLVIFGHLLYFNSSFIFKIQNQVLWLIKITSCLIAIFYSYFAIK